MHVKTKQNPDKVKGGIYSIPCDCGKVYIGETGRPLKDRLGEHKRSVTNGESYSGIYISFKQEQYILPGRLKSL